MAKYPIILDLETKRTFRDVDRHRDLGISVVGIYDYKSGEVCIFTEDEFNKLFSLLENASYVIGFNIKNFDMPVLQAYYPGDITQFAIFDICDDVKERIGRRMALNDLLHATLGKKKSGHGLEAVDLYNQNKWEELKNYCRDDVTLTKELYDFGARYGHVCYLDEVGKKEVEVDWKRYLKDTNNRDTHLILPF